MITRTSFNQAFADKVRAAMRRAVLNSAAWGTKGQAYVSNRRGKLMLRVDYDVTRSPAFAFWAPRQRDITPLAIEQIRHL